MNRKRVTGMSLTLALILVLVSACTAPQAKANLPTTQSCPTAEPQSCPTPALLAQPPMDDWRVDYNDEVNIRVTFDSGDKCNVEMVKPARDLTYLRYEIVVNDQTYENYLVAGLTLFEGKTLKDLEDYDEMAKGPVNAPPFSDIQLLDIVAPMSRTLIAIRIPKSPIYFVCIVEGPVEQQIIDEFGPFDIVPK